MHFLHVYRAIAYIFIKMIKCVIKQMPVYYGKNGQESLGKDFLPVCIAVIT